MAERRTVVEGDCFSSIAFETGFFADTLWQRAENSALREQRSSPYVLLPGDVVFVPDLEPKSVGCGTGARHVFRRKGVPARLRLRLLDKSKPRAKVPYAIVFEDGTRTEGTTGDDGTLQAFITPSARTATLILKEGSVGEQRFELLLGRVTPTSSDAGVAARLVNLGYLEPDQVSDPAAVANALTFFQRSNELDATGLLDAATEKKLRELHGD